MAEAVHEPEPEPEEEALRVELAVEGDEAVAPVEVRVAPPTLGALVDAVHRQCGIAPAEQILACRGVRLRGGGTWCVRSDR